AVLVFRDESERKRTETALRNADRRKDEFLATLAHELRNPLAPISTGLEILAQSAHDPRAIDELRAMMQRQTQHMVRLIDDLMDVSRITRGKLELRKDRVDLADVVRLAVEATRPIIEQDRHELIVRMPDEPLLLYADANRLTQVIVNLLNNAAKYTPARGRIEIAAERAGNEVSLTVSDTGIGIPSDKLGCVFDMFEQIEQHGQFGHSGLGIGLTLVQRLVELHGGSVQVESPGRNQGTTFRIRIPVMPPSAAPTNGAAGQRQFQPPAVKRRILVVDDNADALETLSRLVSLLGGDVRRAHDGLEALEVAQAFQPEIVLMDLGMPRLNGYEAARRMRQEPWGRQLTLVATSGWGQQSDRQRTADAGFDHHLVKPIETAALREVLNVSP
ncbi:MAG: response regulator, partial [Pirellulales bacterium]|nr:response regulator [Pirellulales bacterium]